MNRGTNGWTRKIPGTRFRGVKRSVIKTCSTSLLGTRVGRNIEHGLFFYYTYKKHQSIAGKYF